MQIIFLEFDTYATAEKETKSFNDFVQCFNYEKYKDRPCYPTIIQNTSDSTINFYRYLNDNIHNWFQYMNGDYSMHYEVIQTRHFWYLEIPNSDVAMLFKLTWL